MTTLTATKPEVLETFERCQVRQGNLLLVPVDPPAHFPDRNSDEYTLLDPRSQFTHRIQCRNYGHLIHVLSHTRLSHESHVDVLVAPGWYRPVVQRQIENQNTGARHD